MLFMATTMCTMQPFFLIMWALESPGKCLRFELDFLLKVYLLEVNKNIIVPKKNEVLNALHKQIN